MTCESDEPKIVQLIPTSGEWFVQRRLDMTFRATRDDFLPIACWALRSDGNVVPMVDGSQTVAPEEVDTCGPSRCGLVPDGDQLGTGGKICVSRREMKDLLEDEEDTIRAAGCATLQAALADRVAKRLAAAQAPAPPNAVSVLRSL